MKRKTSIFGVVVTIIAFVVFTFLAYKLIGLWCVIVGPFVALMACRPAKEGSPWLWQKDIRGTQS